jgi:glucan phosphoethanolaminetransferase (alkaline phosphatase superfamily)
LSETRDKRDEWVSRIAEFAALALIPGSILLGDFQFRWIEENAHEPRVFIGWFSFAVALSLAFWWGLNTAVRGTRARYWVLPATVFPFGVLIVASWRFRTVRHFDPAATVVAFILEEPIYSLELAAAGVAPGWTAAIVLLPAAWLALSLFYASRTAPPQRTRLIAGLCAIAVPPIVWLGFPSVVENPWTPYPTDMRVLKVAEQGVHYYSQGVSSMKVVPTERDTPESVQDRDGPSVLLVVGESVRNDRTNLWGEPGRVTTPRLKQLADERPGEVFAFQRHDASTAATFGSGVGILLGKYFATDAEVLRRVPVIWQYADAAGLESFLVSAQPWSWASLREFYVQNQPPDHFWDARELGLESVNDAGGDDLAAAEKVVDILENELDDGEPFMGVFQLNATHFPYHSLDDVDWPLDSPIDRYDASIARSDRAIGRVIDALERTGRLDSTVIMFVSDHAIEMNTPEHKAGHAGMRKADPALFQGARVSSCEPIFVRTPLMLFVPEAVQSTHGLDRDALAGNTQRLTSHVDVLTTVLDLWDVEPAEPLDGRSLLEPLEEDRLVYCFTATRVPSVRGVGIHADDRYVYLRANLQRPYAYDVDDPDTFHRRRLGGTITADDEALIRRACADSPQARGVLDELADTFELDSLPCEAGR